MNYFKRLIATLFVASSLVYAAANPRVDVDGDCHFDEADSQRLVQIVIEGDNAAPLAEMLEGCQVLVFAHHLQAGLEDMIRLRRHVIFQYLIPILDFRVAGFTRGQIMGGILGLALGCNSIEIVDFLMDHGARVQNDGRPIWLSAGRGVWNLEDLKGLISRHPRYAAALTPTGVDMSQVSNAEDARILVELTRHCDSLTGQETFDATTFLIALLSSDNFIPHEELARMALMLFQEGAQLNDAARERFELHPEAYQLFNEWIAEDIKEPEGN